LACAGLLTAVLLISASQVEINNTSHCSQPVYILRKQAGCQLLMPVTLATREAEVKGLRFEANRQILIVLNRTSSFSPVGGDNDVLNPGPESLGWDWDMAQGRLRVEATKPQQCSSKTTQTLRSITVEATKPQQCPLKTTQTLGSMQQHLFAF
jgi:hypothetical protein